MRRTSQLRIARRSLLRAFDEATSSIGVNRRQTTAYQSSSSSLPGRNPVVVRSTVPPSVRSACAASRAESE